MRPQSLLKIATCLLGLASWLAAAPAAGAAERGPVRASAQALMADLLAPRVIVRFKADSSTMRALSAGSTALGGPRRAAALSLRTGLSLRNGRALDSRTQVLVGSGLSSAALAQQLARQSDVEWAVVDQRRRAAAVPDDPLYAADSSRSPAVGQWYLRAPSGSVKSAINAEAAWQVTEGSASVVVAVLDTGVRSNHPDLAGKLLAGYDFVSDVPTANDGDARDSDPADPGDWVTALENSAGDFAGCGVADSSWHGTQVAGLIGAATHNGIGMAGVAPNVMLLPVRVLGKCGGYDSDIIAAMRWAAGLSVPGVPTNPTPAQVLNLSLGSSGSCTSAYQSAVSAVVAAGSTVVVAAGNEGLAIDAPANCSGVVAVTGVRHTGTKVGYSNLGSQATVAAPAGNCVNLSGECLYPLLTTTDTGTTSPLSSTYSTGGANASLGTSFAAPLVSGAVALMYSASSSMTPSLAGSTLRSTARAFPTTGADAGVSACHAPNGVAQDSECYCTTSTCGAGLLDASAAVSAVLKVVPAISASATSVVAGGSVTLDGSGSTVDASRSIASYLWEITSGASLASFSSATDAASVTLLTSAAGTVTVRLTVTDSAGAVGRLSQTLTVTAAGSGGGSGSTGSSSGGSGGGGLSPLAGLALGLLALAWPRRRRG